MPGANRRFGLFTKAPSKEALAKLNNMANGLEDHEAELAKLRAYGPYTIFICADDQPAAIQFLALKKGTED